MARQKGKGARSPAPKAMMPRYEALTAATDAFCKAELTEEYAELARRAIAALCRKRPSPVASGTVNVWACGVVYALGQVNFLFDAASSPCISPKQLGDAFRVAASTGAAKAKIVRDALGMGPFEHRWLLEGNAANNPALWMIFVDGFAMDVRNASRALQMAAFERGLIPYVPADGPDSDPAVRNSILESYDRSRTINMRHQTVLAKRLRKGPLASAAVVIGLVKTQQEAVHLDLDTLAPAADLSLYGAPPGSTSVIDRYLEESAVQEPGDEKAVLEAMSHAIFSIFRITGLHRGAGVDMLDLLSGEQIWLVDRGIDLSGIAGVELATRVFRPEDFWMTTGVTIQLDDAMWRQLERLGVKRTQNSVSASKADRNVLAEAVYRLHSSKECADA